MRACFSGLIFLLLSPSILLAADDRPLQVAWFAVIPFAGLLLAIAILPLAAGSFWHSNLKKLYVALGFSAPVLAYLGFLQAQGEPGWAKLEHSLLDYFEFLVLLGSLYTITGGVMLLGDLRPSAIANSLFLLIGAALANVIGTTGASMLLIRPFLRINAGRANTHHLPVFFIFLVSNLGGLLTPLGDPPLFLGFLKGVEFFWTLSLWRIWLVAVGSVLAIFFVWDTISLRREPTTPTEELPGTGRLRFVGTHNFLFLFGILAAALLHSDQFAGMIGVPKLQRPWGSVIMIAMAGLSLLCTSRQLRRDNEFTWDAILEVAVLFLGIFITMVPALALLETDGARLGLSEPWQFFWATGGLSSFLDNAPTYLTFAMIAKGDGATFASLAESKPLILQAISAGAVLMGANTYIGNGPNFMVKAIADGAGYKTPSFFGYMIYSSLILLPVFTLVCWLFFVP